MSNNNPIQNIKDIPSKNLDWGIVQNDMKSKFGSDIYESWIRKIEFIEEMSNYILLSVSSRFIRDWITSRYLDQILQVVKVYKKILLELNLRLSKKIQIILMKMKMKLSQKKKMKMYLLSKILICNILELIPIKGLTTLLQEQATN